MPLKTGKSNIDKALSIALKTAGGPKRRADGGGVASDGFTGALTGDTPGRADKLPVTVPDGSHVIPADVVGALGDGNSGAGLKHLGKMFPTPKLKAPKAAISKPPHIAAPHLLVPKISMPKMNAPKAMGMPKRADGGASRGVKCALSDGEFVVHPEHVARIGGGDAERGHRALDHWIVSKRKEDIERRKKLPPPVGS